MTLYSAYIAPLFTFTSQNLRLIYFGFYTLCIVVAVRKSGLFRISEVGA